MPDRKIDNRAKWFYSCVYPGGDYRGAPSGAKEPMLVDSVGVDGRNQGTIRPFPGFADATVHGIPTPSGSTTVTSLTGIQHVQYAALQKGVGRDVIRGLVYLTTNGVYFAYVDSSDPGTPNVVKLERHDSQGDGGDWDDFYITSLLDYDITSMGRYIYFAASADLYAHPTNLEFMADKELPYNKAYFWDFKVNDWDAYGVPTTYNLVDGEVVYKWTQSGAAGNEYHVELAGGGDPSLAEPTLVYLVGLPVTEGAPGSLAAGTWGYGDNDTLGYSTIYVRTSDSADPDSKDSGYVKSTHHVDGFLSRFMSGIPVRGWISALNEPAGDDFGESSDRAFTLDSSGVAGSVFEAGVYSVASQLVSKKHNLRSPLRVKTLLISSDTKGLFATVRVWGRPRGQYRQILSGSEASVFPGTCLYSWGIPHSDGFNLYRTLVSQTNVGSMTDQQYRPASSLYLSNEYVEKSADGTVGLEYQQQFDIDEDQDNFIDQAGLPVQEAYNAWMDEWSVAPRLRRLTAYAGLLIGVTDIEEPTAPNDKWTEVDRKQEALAWSTLVRDEPENFPAANRFRPDDPAVKFHSLEPAGDHLFAVSSGGIYRLTRAGSQMAINLLQSRVGGLSRHGQTGVGNSLFIVTASGFKEVDGNTGESRSLPELDRLLIHESEWGQSLVDVQVEYDAQAGCIVLLNTTEKECILLWESTGAVTRVRDCPWDFITAGPDVLQNTPQRVFFVTATGSVTCIDAFREMGKRSMCGVAADETVNGACTSGTTATTLKDSAATFPANCVGHKVYILSGTYAGESAEITVRDSDTELTLNNGDLSGAPSVDDRFSIAPVVTELVFATITAPGGTADPFGTKTVRSMMAAFSCLGGEIGDSHDNDLVAMGLQLGGTSLVSEDVEVSAVPDQCNVKVVQRGTLLYPYLRFLGGNIDFELGGVLAHGIGHRSEQQSPQG